MILAVSFLPFFEAKNEAAGNIADPAGVRTRTAEAVRPDLTAREKCPACAGKGRIKLIEPELGQYNGRIGARARKTAECPLCRGAGRLAAFTDPDALALQVAKDRETFEATHLSRGEIPVGEAFLPRETYDRLATDKDKEILKLVKEAYGEPCAKCNWTGIEPCRKCGGKGVVKCTGSDCKNGWTVTKTSTSCTKSRSGGNSLSLSGSRRQSGGSRVSRKEERISVSVCPDCGGAALVKCGECGGRRAIPCRKCNGTGVKRTRSALR